MKRVIRSSIYYPPHITKYQVFNQDTKELLAEFDSEQAREDWIQKNIHSVGDYLYLVHDNKIDFNCRILYDEV